jgi:hypothetical protein
MSFNVPRAVPPTGGEAGSGEQDETGAAAAPAEGVAAIRVFATRLGDLPAVNVDMREFRVGDRMVATWPHEGAVFEVTGTGVAHGYCWLEIRSLTMTDEEAAALGPGPGTVAEGSDPRKGSVAFELGRKLYRVVEEEQS